MFCVNAGAQINPYEAEITPSNRSPCRGVSCLRAGIASWSFPFRSNASQLVAAARRDVARFGDAGLDDQHADRWRDCSRRYAYDRAAAKIECADGRCSLQSKIYRRSPSRNRQSPCCRIGARTSLESRISSLCVLWVSVCILFRNTAELFSRTRHPGGLSVRVLSIRRKARHSADGTRTRRCQRHGADVRVATDAAASHWFVRL